MKSFQKFKKFKVSVGKAEYKSRKNAILIAQQKIFWTQGKAKIKQALSSDDSAYRSQISVLSHRPLVDLIFRSLGNKSETVGNAQFPS